MDLDEFCWRYKVKLKQISQDTGISLTSLSTIKSKRFCPTLEHALILCYYTAGEVDLMSFLPEKNRTKVESFIEKHNASKK